MRHTILIFLALLCACVRAQDLNTCYTITPDDFKPYTAAQLAEAKDNQDTLLPTVYLEVDYDIVQHFGGVGPAEEFIRGAFEQVAAVYRRDATTDPQLILYVHDQPSGYVATTSGGSLQEFRLARPSHPGNVAQLVSFRGSGGIAYVDQVCGPVNYSYSSIDPTYAPYTVYSWTVMVIGHELGHLFGSLHTQACVWNGDNTPLDGCWQPEGDCARPPVPDRGSMMSYCHLNALAENDLRILPQPAAVMRAAMMASGCVSIKPAGPGEPEPCDYEVTLSLATDLHPRETSWRITDASGQTVATSRPYAKHEYLTTIDTTICLPEGCYDLAVTDPDGISSSRYFYGSYAVTVAGDTLATGGEFAGTDLREFCLGDEQPTECDYLDLSAFQPYGGNQDNGTAEVSAGGTRITLYGNAWKSIPFEYEVISTTVLEVEFKGGPMGEIHAVGLDENNIISSNRAFRLGGSQTWGNGNYAVYPQGGAGWMRVRIPIGRHYTGPMSELFFISDKDMGTPNNVSTFKNVRVHDGQCVGSLPVQQLGAAAGAKMGMLAVPGQPQVFTSDVPTRWQFVDALGRVLHAENTKRTTFRIDVNNAPPGVYYVAYSTDEGPEVQRVLVR